MITQSASSKFSRAKYLLVAPLLIVTIVCCSKSQYSGERKKDGNKITYKGNVFEMSKSAYDTVQMMDAVSGKTNTTVIERLPYPIKMNGTPILEGNQITQQPVYKGASATPGEDLFEFIKPDLNKLPDGDYLILVGNCVIDAQGQLAYFDAEVSKQGVSMSVQDVAGNATLTGDTRDVKKMEGIDKSTKEAIDKRIDYYLGNELMRFTPAKKDGKTVVSYNSSLFGFIGVTVKNHQANLTKE